MIILSKLIILFSLIWFSCVSAADCIQKVSVDAITELKKLNCELDKSLKCSDFYENLAPELKNKFEIKCPMIEEGNILKTAFVCSPLMITVGASAWQYFGLDKKSTINYQIPPKLKMLFPRILPLVSAFGTLLSLYSVGELLIKGIESDKQCFENIEMKTASIEYLDHMSKHIVASTSGLITNLELKILEFPKEYQTKEFIHNLTCQQLKEIFLSQKRKQDKVIGRLLASLKLKIDPRKNLELTNDERMKLQYLYENANCISFQKKIEIYCSIGSTILGGVALKQVLSKIKKTNNEFTSSSYVTRKINANKFLEKINTDVSPQDRLNLMISTGLTHIEDSSNKILNIYKLLGVSNSSGHTKLTSELPNVPLFPKFKFFPSKTPTSVRFQVGSDEQLANILNKGIASRARVENVEHVDDIERLAAADKDIFKELAFTQKIGQNNVNLISVETTSAVPVIKEFTDRTRLLKDNGDGLVFMHVKNDRAIPFEENVATKGWVDDEKGHFFLGGIHPQEIKKAFFVKKAAGKLIYQKHEKINNNWEVTELSKESFEVQVVNF